MTIGGSAQHEKRAVRRATCLGITAANREFAAALAEKCARMQGCCLRGGGDALVADFHLRIVGPDYGLLNALISVTVPKPVV